MLKTHFEYCISVAQPPLLFETHLSLVDCLVPRRKDIIKTYWTLNPLKSTVVITDFSQFGSSDQLLFFTWRRCESHYTGIKLLMTL